MTGRYFRSNTDYHGGPTQARDIAAFLAKTRQNLVNAPESIAAQLRALETHLSDQLRTGMQVAPDQALQWVEQTLGSVRDKHPDIDNLIGLGSFDAVYDITYAAYEGVIREIIKMSPNAGLVEFLEAVLTEMDNLADRIAVYEECQRPLQAETTLNGKGKGKKNGNTEIDYLSLLRG